MLKKDAALYTSKYYPNNSLEFHKFVSISLLRCKILY